MKKLASLLCAILLAGAASAGQWTYNAGQGTISHDSSDWELYVSAYGADLTVTGVYQEPSAPSALPLDDAVGGGYGITSIDGWAFYECSVLTSVTIPDSVTSISDQAFGLCSSLTSVTIGNGVTYLGYSAFYSCTGLKSVSISAENIFYSSVDGVLFNKNKDLLIQYPAGKTGAYSILASVTSIGDDAFFGCGGLTSVDIHDNVISIGSWAFANCSSLTSVTIPDSVTSIGYLAFIGCGGLASISVSAGNMFYSSEDGVLLNKTKDLLILYPAKKAGEYSIPDSVANIANCAFYECRDLTSVTIGERVASIGENSFFGCSGLTNIFVSVENTVYSSMDGVLFDKSKELLILCPMRKAGAYSIPDSVTSIGAYAFEYCDNLTSVTIPDSVTSIGDYAFEYCDNLTSVTIPDSVTNIGIRTFFCCYALTSVIIGSGVTSIGASTFSFCYDLTSVTITDSVDSIDGYAFYCCESLMNVTIPNSVTNIDDYAFAYCYNLREVIFEGECPATGNFGNIFAGAYNATIFVPQTHIASWEANLDYGSFANGTAVWQGCPVILYDKSVVPVPAVEMVPYSCALNAGFGTPPHTWSLLGGEYGETQAASTFGNAGVAQGWRTDDGYWELDLPFDFPFFGKTHNKIYVGSNGILTFDYGNSWYFYDENDMRHNKAISVLGWDLRTDSGNIYVESSASYITIRWQGTYFSGGSINISATLHRSGKIVLSYGEGNSDGGFIGISKGDGETYQKSAMSDSGGMNMADDIVFAPGGGLPEGLELSENGVISGTTDVAGTYEFDVMARDAAGMSVIKSLTLVVEPNPNTRPVVDTTTPPAGYVNLGGGVSQNLSLSAHDPEGAAVSYSWALDGVPVGNGAASYLYSREAGDISIHTVRCHVSDDLWTTQVCAEWLLGELSISTPQGATVSAGMDARLGVDVACVLPSEVKWFAVGSADVVGDGASLLLRKVRQTASYYAVAENVFGAVTSGVATVTATPAPAVGRIYKTSGAPFVGNRLVLSAASYGAEPLVCTWLKDGLPVAVSKTLDIAALAPGDYGDYTLRVSNAHGNAISEAFTLSAPASGTVQGWGWAADHGRTTTPDGLTDVAQVSAGMHHNLALSTNGAVTAWGYNKFGQTNVPDGLDNVAAVVAGGFENKGVSFAIKRDGSVAGWGQSSELSGFWGHIWDMQLMQEVPYWYVIHQGADLLQIPAEAVDVVSISVGGSSIFDAFAVALNADGTVVAWGSSENGPRNTPAGLDDVVAIAAGVRHALALKADGTVVAWGENRDGQCDVPADLADVIAIDGAYNQSIALKSDGTIVVWGDYDYDGDYFDSATQGGLPKFVDIAVGEDDFIGLTSDGTVFQFYVYWNNWSREWNCYPNNEPANANIFDAFAVAAGAYHYQAIVPDSDRDGVSDRIELELGRDPNNPSDGGASSSISGTVSGAGAGIQNANVEFRGTGASGIVFHRTRTLQDGSYFIDNVIPGNYFVKVSANEFIDEWYYKADHTNGRVAYNVVAAADIAGFDFNLARGQGSALVEILSYPSGAEIYLDMQPTGLFTPATIDIGEIGDYDAAGNKLAPRLVNVKKAGIPVNAPISVDVVEGETTMTEFDFSAYNAAEHSGALVITTDPAGAEVYVDYADEPAGVTPLSLSGIASYDSGYNGYNSASHSAHVILLKKDGYLRPRPVMATLEMGETFAIHIPLAPDDAEADQMLASVESAEPEMQVYIDYLPTGKVTDIVIDGMDPASHNSSDWWSWNSASHNVMLRKPGGRLLAPRYVPDLTNIVAQIRFTPHFGADETRTTTTPVPVPHEWLDEHWTVVAGDYETAAHALSASKKRRLWECYLIGLDPMDEDAEFIATIDIVDGQVLIEFDPDLGEERDYKILGKETLDSEWMYPTNSHSKFFKVQVEMRSN